MFPFSITGSIELPSLEPSGVDALMECLDRELRGAGAARVSREGDRLIFRVRLMRIGTSALNGTDGGEILVVPGAPGTARYGIRVHRLFGSMTLFSLIVIGIHAYSNRPWIDCMWMLGIGLVSFGWFFMGAKQAISLFMRVALRARS